jgi:hypothetical protein
MQFSKEAIQQGRANQDASSETPETFARLDGATIPREGRELSKSNSRMAGEMGARALELMNNPFEQKRVEGWMARFSSKPTGMEFNGVEPSS